MQSAASDRKKLQFEVLFIRAAHYWKKLPL